MGELTKRPKVTPELQDKQSGFTFKPKGLIQWDAGYNGYPRGNQLRGTVSGINFQDLGWNSRARRLTLGAEGTLPGGFRYNAEVNFAQGSVDYEDIFIAYDFPNVPVTAQVGNIYPFSSLETMTSSKVTSFLERAGFTDAFNYNRRLGIAFSANDKKLDRVDIPGRHIQRADQQWKLHSHRMAGLGAWRLLPHDWCGSPAFRCELPASGEHAGVAGPDLPGATA